MNHPLLVARGEALAKELNGTPDELVEKIYHLLFGRMPSEAEKDLGLKFLQQSTFADYAQALLASNEFAWLD
jgi:hypothetical protein